MSKTLPPTDLLMQLPPETLDQIASYIDQHSDLLNLALASRACARLIIPRQTQYRVIRVRHATPMLWAHLARRSDLARNVREIHISSRADRLSADKYPVSLIDKAVDGAPQNVDVKKAVENLCKALGHMHKLHTLTWRNPDDSNPLLPRLFPSMEWTIMQAIVKLPSLKHLGLVGPFGITARQQYPLWRIANLESLSLSGPAWIRPMNAPFLLSMLRNSPDLKYLDLPMEFPLLHQCYFPNLLHVKLPLQSGATPSIDKSRIKFLEAHPSITSLLWDPISSALPSTPTIPISPDCLPNLAQLSTTTQTIDALYSDPDSCISSRPIEYLSVSYLASRHIPLLRTLNAKQTLKKLVVQSFDSVETLLEIPTLAPSLTCLAIPAQYESTHEPYGRMSLKLDELRTLLFQLPYLRILHTQALWTAVDYSDEKMHLLIAELAEMCRDLKHLDHRTLDNERRDWMRIVIIREDEGKNVRYEVKRARQRKWFPRVDGRFIEDDNES